MIKCQCVNCFLNVFVMLCCYRMPTIDLPVNPDGQDMEPLRKRVRDHHMSMVMQTKERYQDVLAELFFLQNGGNMMDFLVWKRKPPPSYLEYVKTRPIEVPIKSDVPLFISPVPGTNDDILAPQSKYGDFISNID